MPQKKPILVVVHQEQSSPGRVGRLLAGRGHALDVRRPRYGDPLPATLAEHAGAVIFGGPMSANDPDDWVKREIDWIAVPLREQAPFLGICLGAQMLAKQLGARVSRHPDEVHEIGYWPIRATQAGRALMDWPSHVYHWHSEGFECPGGATLLAEGDTFESQAIKAGPAAYGVQFHPEVTHAMLCRWTIGAEAKLDLPGAQDRATQIEGRFRHDHAVSLWLDTFLDLWLTPARAAPALMAAE